MGYFVVDVIVALVVGYFLTFIVSNLTYVASNGGFKRALQELKR